MFYLKTNTTQLFDFRESFIKRADNTFFKETIIPMDGVKIIFRKIKIVRARIDTKQQITIQNVLVQERARYLPMNLSNVTAKPMEITIGYSLNTPSQLTYNNNNAPMLYTKTFIKSQIFLENPEFGSFFSSCRVNDEKTLFILQDDLNTVFGMLRNKLAFIKQRDKVK